METKDEQKKRPCPACRARKIVPRYAEDDPRGVRVSEASNRVYVPVRCGACGINFEISADPKELLKRDEDDDY